MKGTAKIKVKKTKRIQRISAIKTKDSQGIIERKGVTKYISSLNPWIKARKCNLPRILPHVRKKLKFIALSHSSLSKTFLPQAS